MKYNSINYIKSKMLNEFEKEIEDTFNEYQKNMITTDECISILNSLRGVWSCCRIDLKNYGIESNALELIEYTDNLKIYFPGWFANEEGKGCKIEDEKNDINLKFKCIGNGNLKIVCRGTDFKNITDKSKRNPVYINFKKFKIDDKIIFDKNVLTWHNDEYIFNTECEDGNIFDLNIVFDTIYDYYPELKNFLNFVNKNKVANGDSFIKTLDEKIKEAKHNAKWRDEYMLLLTREDERFAEGRETEKERVAVDMLKKSLPLQLIEEISKLSEDVIRRIATAKGLVIS